MSFFNTEKPSFATSSNHRMMLDVAKANTEAIDRTRVFEDTVVGVDNHQKLMVSTVFSAMAIETALNDYIAIHCLYAESTYLQMAFGIMTEKYQRTAGPSEKIKFVEQTWSKPFPKELTKDVNKLLETRNMISHQKGKFKPSNFENGGGKIEMASIGNVDMLHMLRHYDIANEFLSLFWLPGNHEFERFKVNQSHKMTTNPSES